MSAYNQGAAFATTIDSGVTLSDAIDLGRGWENISVEIPTMTSGTDIFFKAASELTGTYRRCHHGLTSSLDTPAAINIDSSITQCFVPLDAIKVRYLKVELGTAMTATAATFKIVCT